MSLPLASRVRRARAHAVHPVVGLTWPTAVVTLLLLAFPLGFTVVLSLHRWFGSATIPWEWAGLDNYVRAVALDPAFRRSFLITLEFTVATVVASAILGLAIALLIDRPFRGRAAVLALLLVPVVSTPVAVSMTWKFMLQFEGPLNWMVSSVGLGRHAWLGEALILPTLVAVDVTRWTPLVVLILVAGLTSLPTEPFEAARIDGASRWQAIRYLTIPLLRPYLGVAVLIRAIDAIKTFDEIQVISAGGPAGASETLYILGYKQTFTFLSFGAAAAIIVLMFLAILGASLALIRVRRGV